MGHKKDCNKKLITFPLNQNFAQFAVGNCSLTIFDNYV